MKKNFCKSWAVVFALLLPCAGYAFTNHLKRLTVHNVMELRVHDGLGTNRLIVDEDKNPSGRKLANRTNGAKVFNLKQMRKFTPVEPPAYKQAQALLVAAEKCEKSLNQQLDNMVSQMDINSSAADSYACWDKCLNAIWKILKKELPAEQMKQITKEERAWISDKETATETAALDNWGGTLFSGIVSSEQAEWTKRRAYELADYLKSIPNIVVHNELEFLKALGSNRVVTIAEGSNINLSNVLDLSELREQAGLGTTEVSTDTPIKLPQGKYANQAFDGNELLLMNIKNLTIVGKGEKRPKIVVDPRYAYILNCVNCTNINIRHLEIGHTQTGWCFGGVLRFEACRQVSIDDCDMYGCGIEGITAKQTIDLRCARSIIRDCSYSIMTVEQSKQMHFIDCQFTHNREFTLVNVDDESGVFFTKCRFTQNEGCLFALKSFVHMNGCYVKHPIDGIGDRDYIIEKDCTWETH